MDDREALHRIDTNARKSVSPATDQVVNDWITRWFDRSFGYKADACNELRQLFREERERADRIKTQYEETHNTTAELEKEIERLQEEFKTVLRPRHDADGTLDVWTDGHAHAYVPASLLQSARAATAIEVLRSQRLRGDLEELDARHERTRLVLQEQDRIHTAALHSAIAIRDARVADFEKAQMETREIHKVATRLQETIRPLQLALRKARADVANATQSWWTAGSTSDALATIDKALEKSELDWTCTGCGQSYSVWPHTCLRHTDTAAGLTDTPAPTSPAPTSSADRYDAKLDDVRAEAAKAVCDKAQRQLTEALGQGGVAALMHIHAVYGQDSDPCSFCGGMTEGRGHLPLTRGDGIVTRCQVGDIRALAKELRSALGELADLRVEAQRETDNTVSVKKERATLRVADVMAVANGWWDIAKKDTRPDLHARTLKFCASVLHDLRSSSSKVSKVNDSTTSEVASDPLLLPLHIRARLMQINRQRLTAIERNTGHTVTISLSDVAAVSDTLDYYDSAVNEIVRIRAELRAAKEARAY
jgi:hypothetical protein